MNQEPRFFIVMIIMHGYVGTPRRYHNSRLLQPCVLYIALDIGKNYLVAVRSKRPTEEIYLPLKSKREWSQVEFAPELSDLAALFNPPAST